LKSLNVNLLALLLIALVLTPFVFISFYNYYSADDYFYALCKIERGFIAAQQFCYQVMNGRYTTTCYLSLLPLAYRVEGFAWLSPLITLSLISVSVYYFASGVFKNYSAIYKLLLTFIILVPFFALLANPAESIYWAAGTASYGTSIFFFFFFLGNITRFLFYGASNRSFVFSMLTLILLIGSNETMTIVADFILMLLFFYDLFTRKKVNFKLIVIATVGIVFTLIVIKSPGNITRLKTMQEMFNYTIKENFSYNSKQILDYISKLVSSWQHNHILTFCDVLLLLLLWKLRAHENNRYRHFLWLFIPVLFFAFFASLFPTFYTLGIEPPNRVLGIQLVFYILFNFFIGFLLYHVLNKWLQKIKPDKINLFIAFAVLLIIFQVSTTTNNIRKAYYYAFFNPEVKSLHQEMKDRIAVVKSSPDKKCRVNNLFNRPTILYRADLSIDDSAYFANEFMAKYYQKERVIVKPFKGNVLDSRFYTLDTTTPELVSFVKDTIYAFSSKVSASMKNNGDYGVTINIPVSEIRSYEKINGIEINFKVLSPDTTYRLYAYFYINNIEKNYSVYEYHKVVTTTEGYPGNLWKDFRYIISMDSKTAFNPSNKIVFFFQNQSNHSVYIDDLKIEFKE
jgi:hypothetical protein